MTKNIKTTNKNKESRNLFSVIDPNARFDFIEAYKELRTNIEFALVDNVGCKKIALISSIPTEGKSTTVVNLAYTIAKTGKSVCVIDGDLRRPILYKYFGYDQNNKPKMGLTDAILGNAKLEDILVGYEDISKNFKTTPLQKNVENHLVQAQKEFENVKDDYNEALKNSDYLKDNDTSKLTEQQKQAVDKWEILNIAKVNANKLNLSVLFSGKCPPNPSELLGSAKMQRLLDELSTQFDYILIDTPPVEIVTDAIVLGKFLDGVVFVLKQDFSTLKSIKNTKKKVVDANIKILGLSVTNHFDNSKKRNKYYKKGSYKYGNYGYSEQS